MKENAESLIVKLTVVAAKLEILWFIIEDKSVHTLKHFWSPTSFKLHQLSLIKLLINLTFDAS